MTIFFTSDLHFGHKNVCRYTERQNVTTAEAHDEWLADIWNSQVTSKDVVWHMGDFSFHKDIEHTARLLRGLNGTKFMIKGNHDNRDVMKRLHREQIIAWFGDYKEIRLQRHADEKPTSACLFHFPITAWHRQHYGALHLHGHCHANFHDGKGKILDVGIDNAYKVLGEHRFFTEVEVLDYMAKREIFIADHHQNREGEL